MNDPRMIRTALSSRRPRLGWPVLWLALALALPAAAQEAALTRRATELRETPAASGRSLAALPAQAPVTRLNERQGPWVRARADAGTTGWLHLFDVAPASATARAESGGSGVGNALRGVTGLFGGTPQPTATTAAGIRGLGAEDLARSQPDTAAVARMEALRQSEAEARAFAAGAALRPVAVEALPAPARPAGNGANRNPESP
ncbi:MAG: SH3 domain-containing protein [Ramlibacter sp.]